MVAPINLTFLGTSSAVPSLTRHHQAMVLRVNGDLYVFDAGENTQNQFQKSSLKMGKITKIFITHMHGDHCFGLAPLLCSMTDNLNPDKKALNDLPAEEQAPPIEIYGPARLRKYLRSTLLATYSNLGRKYRVHELLSPEDESDDNSDDNGGNEINDTTLMKRKKKKTLYHPQELPGSNYRLTPAVTLDLGNGYTITAVGIQHSIPSLGFIFQEPDVMGNMDRDILVPHLERNAAALREQGIRQPLSLLGQLQRTAQRIQLPDGTWLDPPSKHRGRQIVILGDTCDPSSIIPYCHQPHLLVHESTNAFTFLDRENNSDSDMMVTEETVEERTKSHGHSTPQMAGKFAKQIGARTLILTHFSARYKGDDSEEGIKVMEEIRQLALANFGQHKDNELHCARDLWSYDIKHK